MNDLFQSGAMPAILLASGLTYGLRLGGLLLADRLPRSGPARRFLDCLPGTILLSLTVPGALHAGVEGMIGLAACLLVFTAHPEPAADHGGGHDRGLAAAAGLPFLKAGISNSSNFSSCLDFQLPALPDSYFEFCSRPFACRKPTSSIA